MAIGVLIGYYFRQVPDFLYNFEFYNVSIPVAILIWIMIYPMMMKVDFKSVKDVGKNPKGLYLTWVVNWLIKPFTMYAIASFFFFVVFKAFITPELANEYLAGAILLGAAPCTAMVFVWSHLTNGNPAYTVVQVYDFNSDLIWQLEEDGFYHYRENNGVIPTATTIPLFSNLTLDGYKFGNEYQNQKIKVILIVQAKQAKHVTWQDLGEKLLNP